MHALIRRRRRAEDDAPVNVKRVYRVMKTHGLLLQRHTGAGVERRHDGRVAVNRPDLRWCSDGFEIGCANSLPRRRPGASGCGSPSPSTAARLRGDSFRGQAACHYEAKGKYPNPLTPLCPISNGQEVVMRFPGLTKMPAVYIVNDDGTERLARQHAAGDYVVVEEIARHFRLRLGRDVLDLFDTAWNPQGQPTGTGTISPDVQRDLIRASGP